MAVTILCPTCGTQVPAREPVPGQAARCPNCFNLLPDRPAPTAAIAAQPEVVSGGVPSAPNRTVLAEPEAMIRYTCSRCKRTLESPVSFAGQKLNCPSCNQRLQIPQPSTPAAPPINKTVLAQEETSAPGPAYVSMTPTPVTPSAAAQPAPQAPEIPTLPVAPQPTRREGCLECGTDLTNRQRVQTCGDCGALLCSAACQREHRYHAHSRRRRRPAREQCDRCGSTARPYETTVISQGGWITFALLLVFFFPLFWIGLLMTETRVRCADCGAYLD